MFFWRPQQRQVLAMAGASSIGCRRRVSALTTAAAAAAMAVDVRAHVAPPVLHACWRKSSCVSSGLRRLLLPPFLSASAAAPRRDYKMNTIAAPTTTTTTLVRCIFNGQSHFSSTDTHSAPSSSNIMSKLLKSSIPYEGPKTENLVEFIRDGLRKNASETIIIDSVSDRAWTGKEIESMIVRVATHLKQECNLKKGDVCTLYGPPNDLFAILILSVVSAGGVSNFLINKQRGREVCDTSLALGTKFIISTHQLLQDIQSNIIQLIESNPQSTCQPQVISCDEICSGFKNGCKTIGHVLSGEKLALVGEQTTVDSSLTPLTLEQLIESANISPEGDYAVIQFSSGTTGRPKPIPRTHKNLCHLVASVDHKELMDLRPGQVMAGSLPITHRPGLWALLACINAGSTFVLWSNLSDVEEGLSIIEKYKVTILSSSLPFLSMLGNVGIQEKTKYNLSSWQHIITSGAKIVHADLPRSLVKEFNLKSLRQCFGMTESGWVFFIESSLAKDNYLTVGHVVPGTEAAILDRTTGELLARGERGEIALRGPQIFPGYLKFDGAPGEFNRSDFTADGWFKTGDQGYYDENNLVFIEGRYKELMIFENGGRFFPNEIESLISEHPAIEGVCVIKCGEKLTHDVARAHITLKQGCSVTEKEIIDFIAERSLEIILEGGVRIMDQFPRLQNGKVNKHALKDIK